MKSWLVLKCFKEGKFVTEQSYTDVLRKPSEQIFGYESSGEKISQKHIVLYDTSAFGNSPVVSRQVFHIHYIN